MRSCAAVAVMLMGACYSPPAAEHCAIQCPDGVCPEGSTCMADGYCHAPDESPDCGGAAAQGAEIRVGGLHTCAIVGDGQLACWGANRSGELGPATAEPRIAQAALVEVEGVDRWAAVAVGAVHTCAIADGTGALYCWGDDFGEALGNGAAGGGPVPMRPADAPDAGWTAIAGGDAYTCGIADARLYCWGTNLYDQLGLPDAGDSVDVPTPVDPAAWSTVAAGETHTCGVRLDGHLFCWGDNGSGKLGLDDELPRDAPAEVGAGGMTWKTVSVGAYHTCAIRADDTLHCWGAGGGGQLGVGYDDHHTPFEVDPERRWRAVAAGAVTTCAVTLDDQLYCWGDDGAGQRGDGPVDQPGLARIAADQAWDTVAAAAHAGHACARTTAGELYCWGADLDGQIGDGTFADEHAPVQIGTAVWRALWAGFDRTCGIRDDDGLLYCWGGFAYDQSLLLVTPTRFGSESAAWTGIALGAVHGCAVDTSLNLWCWGNGSHGELGTGDREYYSAPVEVLTSTDWKGVAAGREHTCALSTAGDVVCFGDNSYGQLGNLAGGDSVTAVPVDVAGVNAFLAVAAGESHTCAAGDAGNLYCWGANDVFQSGATDPSAPTVPFDIPNGSWDLPSLGFGHSCARLGGGGFQCWGNDDKGQLGRVGGGSGATAMPTAAGPAALDSWIEIAAGGAHTCARRGVAPDREIYCWGQNARGQVGASVLDEDRPPVEVGDGHDWTRVVAGESHTCALDSDGSLWCWGAGDYGQLGDGDSDRLEPTAVLAPP